MPDSQTDHELICWNCGAQYHGAVDDCPHCDGYGQ